SLYSAAGHRKYLNHEERQRVLAVMTRLKTDHALLALTLAWSGARPSEVLALTPSSFQVTASLISMRTLKRRRAHVREVPIPPQLMRALADHFDLVRAQANPKRACTRLWPYCRVTAWRIIKTAMACARVGGVAATPRGLRHGFGVATLQAGVPINLVQRWLGHARLSTTAIYADVLGPEELSFAERFWSAGDRRSGAIARPRQAALIPQQERKAA